MKILSIKYFFNIFLVVFFLTGSLSSINVGISHDEWHEEQNWKFNLEIIENTNKKIFSKDTNNFNKVSLDQYYGIGFQFVSQPIQSILKSTVQKYQNVNDFGAKLISKHFVIFLFFFISGICFFQIIKKTIKDKNICYFSTCIYFLYPYLLGHSMFNPKDVPFMSIWLLCTYLSLNIFEKLLKGKSLTYLQISVISFCTAFLLSIRVTGVLIFFQYLITFIIFINSQNTNLVDIVKQFYKKFLLFIVLLTLFIFILNPVYWANPVAFIHAIKWMSHYYHDICTNTFGKCLSAKDLPPTYMLIWFSVKLPLIIILGILLIPFIEKKIFQEKRNTLVYGSILVTAIFIPLLLIFINVNLYDEIRHVMFLIPLFFILGLTSLFYFSKRFFYILGFLSISIFLIENFKIYPYQYVWFNTPSRYLDLTKKFELEYMGISGKEISKKIISLDQDKICILASPGHTVEPYFHKSKFTCFDKWQLIDTNYKRPFFAVQHVRNIKKGIPYNCRSIYDSGFKLLFHKERFTTGKLLKCF